MADWVKMMAGVLSFGFILDMFAISGNNTIVGFGRAVEALEICGFLLMMIGFVLALAAVFSNLKGNKGVIIAATVFAFLGGILVIVGFAMFASRLPPQLIPPYTATLLVCAAALAIAGGIFGAIGLTRS